MSHMATPSCHLVRTLPDFNYFQRLQETQRMSLVGSGMPSMPLILKNLLPLQIK